MSDTYAPMLPSKYTRRSLIETRKGTVASPNLIFQGGLGSDLGIAAKLILAAMRSDVCLQSD